MSEWFRHIQKHAKTSAPEAGTKSSQTQGQSNSTGRSLTLFRPSSYASLASVVSGNGTDVAAPASTAADNTGHSRDPSPTPLTGVTTQPSPADLQNLWHRPTLEQIVDALYVAMMTKPVGSPLPVEYNVYVQHLLEGYSSQSRALRETEELLAEEKETKRRSMVEFAKMSKGWEEREAAYMAEIKRMEVYLAKSAPEGVQAVVLARSGSIMNRSRAESRRFKTRLSHARQDAGTDAGDKGDDNETSLDSSIMSNDLPHKPIPRSHKTILTMRRSVNHHADQDMSEKIRGLSKGVATLTSDTSTGEIRSLDKKAGDGFEQHGEGPLEKFGAVEENRDDERSAKPSVPEHESNTSARPAKLPSAKAEQRAGKTSKRTTRRGHRRSFSFDPGEDELSLPKPDRSRWPAKDRPDLEGDYDERRGTEEGQTEGLPRELDGPIREVAEVESVLTTEIGSTSSRRTVIRDTPPPPSPDHGDNTCQRIDNLKHDQNRTPALGTVLAGKLAGRADEASALPAVADPIQMAASEQTSLGDASLAAQRAMAQGQRGG